MDLFVPRKRHSEGLSGFWFGSIGVLAFVMSPVALLRGDVAVGLLLLAAAPFCLYEALMKYRCGRF
jgi:hypothetical protein